jgi:hypothetical protein
MRWKAEIERKVQTLLTPIFSFTRLLVGTEPVHRQLEEPTYVLIRQEDRFRGGRKDKHTSQANLVH